MKRNGNPWKYENGYWHEWKKKSDGKVGWVQQVGIPVDEIQDRFQDNYARDRAEQAAKIRAKQEAWTEKEAERKFGNKLWKLSGN